MTYYKNLGDLSFEQLEDPDFHFQPNPASNSIAIIIRHLSGNMLSRWTDFLTTDGEKESRNRDAEFEPVVQSREILLATWEKGWACFLDALSELTEDDLLKSVRIRQELQSVPDAIIRQTAHYPYHVGQIVYIARMIRNEKWKNLSIPLNESDAFNAEMKKRNHPG
jgi:hypothetical protein